MVQLKVNGQAKDFAEDDFPKTISQLLKKLEISEEAVVAELDGNIIPRENFATAQLTTQSTVELIRFVGGG